MFSPSISEQGSGYTIANSLRLRASASAYLSRTPSGNANGGTWTFSGWVKRGALGVNNTLFSDGATSFTSAVRFNTSDQLQVELGNQTSSNYIIVTSAVFRDPSAWMHVVAKVYTSDATAANRVLIYVNGALQTTTGTQPTLSFGGAFTTSYPWRIGDQSSTTHYYLDGYLADVYFIDGQALDPTYFGQFNSDGVWTPKAYTGTNGTNGFKLDFSNGSSLTTLGNDASGNGNSWTLNGFSLTGVTTDWMVDTPTNNYCTINPLDSSGTNTVSAGNLTYVTGTTFNLNRSTFALTTGKWYWEVTGFSGIPGVGVSRTDVAVTSAGHTTANGWAYFGDTGNKWTNNSGAAYGATFGTTDVIGVALDMDAGTLTFYKNNTSQGVAFSSGLLGQSLSPMLTSGLNASGGSFNFGQRPFQYTPPTGFKALCTANLPAAPIPNGRKHFDVRTRTGNGSSQSISDLQFQPDLDWTKARNRAGYDHYLLDSVRGGTKWLGSSSTAAEATIAQAITSFNSNGVTFGSDAGVNENTATYVDWLWKANGAAVTNNAGSITSQVSANTTAGFSIVTYTGTGANATVGHGLGVAPKMVIVKDRTVTGSAAPYWFVYHASQNASPATGYLALEQTAAFTTNAAAWNNTVPTSSVFSIGAASQGTNYSGHNFVAYAFAEVAGFSKIGSYTGNGSADGPFVFCGFRPRFVMIKRSNTANGWYIVDAVRNTVNVIGLYLEANASTSEGSAANILDFTANGFKLRGDSTYTGFNGTSDTYIFYAVGEHPTGGSNVAPATAR